VRLSNFSSQSLLHWVCNYRLNAWAITITCLYYLWLCLSKFFTEIFEYLIHNKLIMEPVNTARSFTVQIEPTLVSFNCIYCY
jgi:hypothetical protein